jgi:chromosomal replication initiator protein
MISKAIWETKRMDPQKTWQAVLGELEVTLSGPNFKTWLKNTTLDEVSGEVAKVLVPTAFSKAWLERKLHDDILAAIAKHAPSVTTLEFKVGRTIVSTPPEETPRPRPAAAPETPAASTSTARLTFDNFVVGKSNQLAHAAALAVSRNPGGAYNPLFLYGSAGLGKTHLMKAIGREIEQTTDKRVVYVTTEKFTNDFIAAVSTNRTQRFKDQYRQADVLMFDDVQFLAGKESTKEEFFHTFNALRDDGRQVIMTSDRPPKAIPTLEDRLQSRLVGGMITDLGPPELETRAAILRTKAKERGYEISDEVVDYIAKSIQQNVRELEGALIRIMAHSELTKVPLTVKLAEQVLGSIMATKGHRKVSPDQVVEAVARFYDVSIEDLKGPRRQKEIVKPRQLIMFLLREEASLSYPKIGRELGGRDHTTVIHAVEKIGQQSEASEPLRHELNLIKERLYA